MYEKLFIYACLNLSAYITAQNRFVFFIIYLFAFALKNKQPLYKVIYKCLGKCLGSCFILKK